MTFITKEESIIFEGCGCVAGINEFGPVVHPKEIDITALDQCGRQFSLRCDGILARVIQHEYDHLHGVGFLEKVSDLRQIVTRAYYKKNVRKSKNQTEASRMSIFEFKYV